jgi:hypothetical protein
MIGNVKTSMHDDYHSIDPIHSPRYITEFCNCLNRRFDLSELLPRFIYTPSRTPQIPYRRLRITEAHG